MTALEMRSVAAAQDQGVPELANQAAQVLRALELRGRDLWAPLFPEVLSCPQGLPVPLEQASP